MNPLSGYFMECDRHPSQFFTGFCPSCLGERLSNVLGVESSKNSCGFSREDGDAYSFAEVDGRNQDAKMRKTLSSLFRLDDERKLKAVGRREHGRDVPAVMQSDALHAGFVKLEPENVVRTILEDSAGMVSRVPEISETGGCEGGSWGTEASCSRSATVENSSSETCFERDVYPRGDEYLRQRSGTNWLGSFASRKVMKWIFPNSSKKNGDFVEEVPNADHVEKFSEVNPKVRHSCDWSFFGGAARLSWEDPRHSWDGSAVSRVFMCSFSCIDEVEDADTTIPSETNCQGFSVSQGSEGNFQEGVTENPKLPSCPSSSRKYSIESIDDVGASRGGHVCRNTLVSKPLGDRLLEEACRDGVVPRSTRKICQKLNKVCNWSISSPFSDFNSKQPQVLDRSISESWRECHKVRAMETMTPDVGSSGNGLSSSRNSTPFNRSKHFGNGDAQSARVTWLKSRNDCKFGRSRSTHYSSPGNLENGLLRFYLTPLRSSRRVSHRGRVKTHSLTRGIFGLL